MKLTVHIDGGSRGNPGPAAAGIVLRDASGAVVHQAGYFLGRLTNNVAEYRGLIQSLELALAAGADDLDIVSDSQLMVCQVNGQYKVKSADLLPLYLQARERLGRFKTWRLRHVLREENALADQMVNWALDVGHDVAAGPGAQPPAPATPGSGDAAGRQVLVAVAAPAGAGCPHPACAGRSFRMGPATPEGLCLHAALTALQELLSPGSELAQGITPAQTLRCRRCGGRIKVSIVD